MGLGQDLYMASGEVEGSHEAGEVAELAAPKVPYNRASTQRNCGEQVARKMNEWD
jgi:hypothetical protein